MNKHHRGKAYDTKNGGPCITNWFARPAAPPLEHLSGDWDEEEEKEEGAYEDELEEAEEEKAS